MGGFKINPFYLLGGVNGGLKLADVTAYNLGNGFNTTTIKSSDYSFIYVCGFDHKNDSEAGRVHISLHKGYMDNGTLQDETIAEHEEYNVLGISLNNNSSGYLQIRCWNGVGFALVFLFK